MVSREKPQPPTENRSTFIARINHLPQSSKDFIMLAYDFTKVAHRGQKREGGDRYFEHPRSVALILLDECKITDPKIIAAGLLHDTMEDSQILGSTGGKCYSEWAELAEERLARLFGNDTAEMVIAVTKPFIDGIEIKDKNDKDRAYHDKLSYASGAAILVKMSDRLHNLRTLGARSRENQRKIIDETKSEYFPLFRKALNTFPNEGGYLLSQMQIEIDKLFFKK